MKTIKSTFLILFLSCVNVVFAWDIFPELHEGEDNERMLSAQEETSNAACSDWYYYIGRSCIPSSQDASIYMHLNLIFMQKDDGTGNFDLENEEYRVFWDDCISNLNSRYANLVNPSEEDACHVDSGFISDVKLQFIPHFYYVRNESGWDNTHQALCPADFTLSLVHIDDSICADPNIPRGINVYFTEKASAYQHYWVEHDTTTVPISSDACSLPPTVSDLFHTSQIHMPDVYCKYWWMKNVVPGSATYPNETWEGSVRRWEVQSVGRTLAHEIGHSLSLYHEDADCLTRIMNPEGGSVGNFMTQCEIGKVYGALMVTNLRTFIPQSTYAGTKHLSENYIYSKLRFYHSLVLDNNSNITFSGEMFFPKQASVTVHSELRLTNSKLHSIDSVWGGIRVKNGGVLRINGASIEDYDIVVESGGSLILAGNLSISGNHHITLQPGSRICVQPNSNITLVDRLSRIRVMDGVISSVDSSILSVPVSGNGSIVDFSDDVYVQRTWILSGDRYFSGNNIYVGSDVTDAIPQGPVQIRGGLVVFDANQTVLEAGTSILSGAEVEIIPLGL